MKNAEFVTRALTDVLGKHIGDEVLVDTYFSRKYVQVVNGQTIQFPEFLAHLNALKMATRSIVIEIKSIAQGEQCVHTQHIAKAEKITGELVAFEVFACFHLADGKIIRCEEVTRQLSGDESDSDLGSRI
ncbi:hypothetical protein [Morganella psychrotolerans]|uniref:Nuclear transport factor 2 family protein n=1 Tax=Morganella psychrotolerans TaxID=368603 RepID=A0A1B8GYS7_9GAMM|nr:hypothetical protein [Morganella psychrotolerans]OBU01982.1 hypothetical protein AYY17_13235 [Morganella psychrotolerans]